MTAALQPSQPFARPFVYLPGLAPRKLLTRPSVAAVLAVLVLYPFTRTVTLWPSSPSTRSNPFRLVRELLVQLINRRLETAHWSLSNIKLHTSHLIVTEPFKLLSQPGPWNLWLELNLLAYRNFSIQVCFFFVILNQVKLQTLVDVLVYSCHSALTTMSKLPIASRVHQVNYYLWHPTCYLYYQLTNCVIVPYQLDAHLLDEELENLLYHQVERALARIHLFNRLLSRFQPELLLLLRTFLFKKSVYNLAASPGQRLLQLKLFSSDFTQVTRKQLTLYGLLTCVVPYLNARIGSQSTYHLSFVEITLTLCKIFNSLLFFTNGIYGSIEQRLSQVTCAYESNEAAFMAQSTEHVARELLWYSFEEFITFLIPLINPVKAKNIWYKMSKASSVPSSQMQTRQTQMNVCAICNNSPVNARQIGCDHCFCYYCVMSTYLADESNGFTCPQCNITVTERTCIKEIYLKGFWGISIPYLYRLFHSWTKPI